MSLYANDAVQNSRHFEIGFRPCVPKQKTAFNKNEKCLIDDINDKKQLDDKLKRSKEFVGEDALF